VGPMKPFGPTALRRQPERRRPEAEFGRLALSSRNPRAPCIEFIGALCESDHPEQQKRSSPTVTQPSLGSFVV
jgi:hypothetical protein